jgi:hypothetical protein
MSREVKTVPGQDSMNYPSHVLAASQAHSSSTRKAPLVLFDPYSHQILVCTQPGGAGALSAPQQRTGRGAVIALRVLQLALLSSLAVMVWFMLKMLQTTG